MKLTKETIEHVSRLVREGHYIVVVCDVMGITRPTYYNWKERGQEVEERLENGEIKEKKLNKNEKLYLEFWKEIKKAEAEAEMYQTRNVSKAGDEGDWRASAWLLEKRWNDRWGKNRLDIEANVNGSMKLEDLLLEENGGEE